MSRTKSTACAAASRAATTSLRPIPISISGIPSAAPDEPRFQRSSLFRASRRGRIIAPFPCREDVVRMGSYDALLKPLTIKHVTFRNRIMGSSHAPAYAKDGKPQERYQLYHEEKAKGGIGLAMFGGSSSVSIDSP